MSVFVKLGLLKKKGGKRLSPFILTSTILLPWIHISRLDRIDSIEMDNDLFDFYKKFPNLQNKITKRYKERRRD